MPVRMLQENSHRLLAFLTHGVVFVIGLYISRGIPRAQLVSRVSHMSANAVDPPTFYSVSLEYKTDKVTSHHYETMYEKYLRKYIATNISILEIGLGCGMPYGPGASAYVWRTYLGPRADIHFVEFDRPCAERWYKEHGQKLNVTMHYGSQEDVAFLKTISTTKGYFDVIVDDGGHTMNQQITSFNHLLPMVRSGGIYVIEDLHTSYMESLGGAYLRNTTTIEFIKRLVDDIHSDSPHKSSALAARLLSFEVSNKICVFNLK